MKIAYLSTFYPYRGGIAQFNAALYREFEKECEIKAFTFKRQYPDMLFPGKTQMAGEGGGADEIPSERLLDSINPLSFGRTADEILKFNPDMAITKFWMPFFGPSLGAVLKKLKKNGVFNISILDNVIPHEKRPGDISLTKYFLRQNHGFVVMSNTVQRDLEFLSPGSKHIYHPHPLYDIFGDKIPKAEAREKLNIGQNEKCLLFFGFIRDYKGLGLLLKALAGLPDSYTLIIAGESYGSFEKYDILIKELGLGGRIYKHVRYIPDSEVPVFFSAADACALPYKSATQSGIVGIAYHFNLPVIATDTGGLKEMVEPYEAGVVAEKATPEDFKSAIVKFFAGGMEGAYADNIEKYKNQFNWKSLAAGIKDFYVKLAGK